MTISQLRFSMPWATVGDVLAFYQERLANESYLRTATETSLRFWTGASDRFMSSIPAWRRARRSRSRSTTRRVRRAKPSFDIRHAAFKAFPVPAKKPQTFETIEKIAPRVGMEFQSSRR